MGYFGHLLWLLSYWKSSWNLVTRFLPIIHLVKHIAWNCLFNVIPVDCMKLLYVEKIHFLIHFFLSCCKEMANLLFWVIWACLATQNYNDSINLKKPLTLICRQKINLILHAFSEILQRYWTPLRTMTEKLTKKSWKHPNVHRHTPVTYRMKCQFNATQHKNINGPIVLTEYHQGFPYCRIFQIARGGVGEGVNPPQWRENQKFCWGEFFTGW